MNFDRSRRITLGSSLAKIRWLFEGLPNNLKAA
jgi:hypothetical protein